MKRNDHEIEEIDDEELQKLVLEAQLEALSQRNKTKTPIRRVPKWIIWLLSIVLFFSTFAFVFEVLSIPAIEFLKTSSKLSAQDDIALYKKSVVVITTNDSKGTGFSISNDGQILTNYHVVEGHNQVTIAFPDDGIFTGEIQHTYPSIDLAILKINESEKDLPYLTLSEQQTIEKEDHIYFIGNPLSFRGIANEGTIIDTIQLQDWEQPAVMIEAPVYRGNSGSPVLNDEGYVIGVVFATLDHEIHGQVGLFVPIEEYFEQIHN